MEAFFAHQAGRCLSLYTLAAIATSLHALFAWQRRPELASAVPKFRPKSPPRQPFSLEELRRLCAVASPRDRALVVFLASTGLRASEVLNGCQADWENGILLVHGKGGRTRHVALQGASAEAYRAIRGRLPSTRASLWRILKELGDRAGVDHAYPHRLRVTFAHDFLEAGGDMQALQKLLGHSSILTTARYSAWGAGQRALDQQRRVALGDRLGV